MLSSPRLEYYITILNHWLYGRENGWGRTPTQKSVWQDYLFGHWKVCLHWVFENGPWLSSSRHVGCVCPPSVHSLRRVPCVWQVSCLMLWSCLFSTTSGDTWSSGVHSWSLCRSLMSAPFSTQQAGAWLGYLQFLHIAMTGVRDWTFEVHRVCCQPRRCPRLPVVSCPDGDVVSFLCLFSVLASSPVRPCLAMWLELMPVQNAGRFFPFVSLPVRIKMAAA